MRGGASEFDSGSGTRPPHSDQESLGDPTMKSTPRPPHAVAAVAIAWILFASAPASAQLDLGPEELVTAGGVAVDVPGYSVPSYVHWNGDGLLDLVVGEGSGTYPPRVRVYLNSGSRVSPQYSSWFYAQSLGADLTEPGSGCLGLFPRVVHWDGDGRKDLLVGRADGTVRIYLNTATDDAPAFDGGTFLEVGAAGRKNNIGVGARATPSVVDWNNDGRKDLVVGAYSGMISVFLNEGTDSAPDFLATTYAQDLGADLVVPSARSSPAVIDFDGDGKKDLVCGNTNGQVLFYANTGLDAAPTFSGYVAVTSQGIPIDLAGTPRSRVFVVDWTGDRSLDLLVGAADGKVHLFQAPAMIPTLGEWGAILFAAALLVTGARLLARRRGALPAAG